MDIPGLSMAMAQINVQSQVGIAMLDKAIDLGDALGEGLVEMIDAAAMERSVTPYLGGNIDLSI